METCSRSYILSQAHIFQCILATFVGLFNFPVLFWWEAAVPARESFFHTRESACQCCVCCMCFIEWDPCWVHVGLISKRKGTKSKSILMISLASASTKETLLTSATIFFLFLLISPVSLLSSLPLLRFVQPFGLTRLFRLDYTTVGFGQRKE